MQFIETGDLKVCYELKGSGYPIVLIMGLTAGMDWWDPGLVDALSEKYRVLMFDNRGAGRTVTPEEGDFSIEMFARDTAALMGKLGIERAHVFGFSMGGIIAQALALEYPEKVSKLVLGGTFCGGKETVMPSPQASKMLLDTSGGLEGAFSRALELMFPWEFLAANPGYAETFRKRFMSAPVNEHNARRQLVASMKLGTYSRLPEIRVPVLVVTGADDILIPPENSDILVKGIPGAKLKKYKDAGHFFMAPAREEFIDDILSFLDE